MMITLVGVQFNTCYNNKSYKYLMYFLDIMMNKYNLHLFSFVEDDGRDWRSLKKSD